MTRRWHVVAILLAFVLGGDRSWAATQDGGGKLQLTVKETAGIRRFSYPVHATVSLPREVTAKDRFRLIAGDKPVAAQFRPVSDSAKKAVALDFNVSVGPFEKLTYTLEYGPKVEAAPEPKGMQLEEGKETFTVRSGGMAYVVPRDLKGLLKEVRSGKKVYTREGSAGLILHTAKEAHALGGAGVKATVVRQGPLAVVLRFECETKLARRPPAVSIVELTFPRSKSWVEVNWRMTPGERGPVQAREVDLNLLVVESPTLVDFGGGSAVYTTLTKGQAALLRAEPPRGRTWNVWEVLTGRGDDLRSFIRVDPNRPTLAEGWAHVMDRQRATAVAIDAFAKYSPHEIRIDADGRLRLRRGRGLLFADAPFRFWLHFVNMPVQVGAVTSPQAMQAPLVVEVGTGK